jgi:hypothetical protein
VPGRVALYAMAALAIGTRVVLPGIHGHAPHTAADRLAPVGPAVTVAGIGLWLLAVTAGAGRASVASWADPSLHGTGHGDLASDYESPETSERIPVDTDVFLVIKQRFWQVTARLLTREPSRPPR